MSALTDLEAEGARGLEVSRSQGFAGPYLIARAAIAKAKGGQS